MYIDMRYSNGFSVGWNKNGKNNKNLIVGLDIGTSSVKTIIALINEDNEIDFLGKGSAKSLNERGMVIDIHSTVQSIKKSVEEAELLAEEEIKSVYASTATTFKVTTQMVVQIADNKEVTKDDLNSVEESAKAMTLPNDQEIIHVLPKDYEIDGQDGIKVPWGFWYCY